MGDTLESPSVAELWLAGQALALLGEHMPLPSPVPVQALGEIYGRLSAQQRAALQTQLDVLRRRLSDLIDGLTFIPPLQPSDPVRWKERLETAIAGGESLAIVYHSAARNIESRRRLLPLWLEDHGGVDYLRAQCIDTGYVLLLRLDRIRAIDGAG